MTPLPTTLVRLMALVATLALIATFCLGCSKRRTKQRSCNHESAARASIEGCAACCQKRGLRFRSWVDPKSAAFAGRARAGRNQLVICSCSEPAN